MPFDFSDRVVLVTGGGSGIGESCARAFHAAGAKVAIFGRTASKLSSVADSLNASSKGSTRVREATVDISDDEAVASAVMAIMDEWGPIYHLVNSAADFVAAGIDATKKQWQRSLEVNVIASAMLTANVAAEMRRGSTVINISSISAHIAQPDRWTYNSSKGAIVELTRCQAMDLAPRGIRVNCVSPGWIWTPEVEKAATGDRERRELAWGRFHMARRLGEPEEVAMPVLFLSSEFSSFITATELMVDGGYSSLGPEGLGDESRFAGSEQS